MDTAFRIDSARSPLPGGRVDLASVASRDIFHGFAVAAMRVWRLWAIGAGVFAAQLLAAQQTPIAYVSTTGVTISGSMSVENGRASIGNDGTIAAGDSTAMVKLARGGDMEVCASTKVHLSRDTSVADASDSALMIALDRGAIEANYVPGKYSDVLLTPDLRILISGPGTADLKIRVNQKGDTCVDNHGVGAPYVTVTSQFEGGVYRVQANQRVMFEHGSLQQVVDNEAEPCGCPVETPVSAAAPVSVASGGVTDKTTAAGPGQKTGNTVAEAANPFPLAESEGLKPPPAAPTTPVVPVGVAHAEVQAPITYDAAATPNPAGPGAAGPAPKICKSTASPGCPNLSTSADSAMPTEPDLNAEIPPVQGAPKKRGGFFHSFGHFFSRMFGG